MHINAYAKINWTLDVIGMLANGFHSLDTIVHNISLYDKLVLEANDTVTLKVNGDASVPDDESNLCYKAANALMPYRVHNKGVKITLTKEIPTGAGLGGGSSNCAAVLLGLNRFWSLNIPLDDLAEIAIRIGSDVPFFLYGGLARLQGQGERISLYSCETTYHLIIIMPRIRLSTGKVFSIFNINHVDKHPDNDRMLKAIQSNDWMQLRASSCNVLTPASKTLCNEIEYLLTLLQHNNAHISFMTGSGSAVIGVYKSCYARDDAFRSLSTTHQCYRARTQNKAVYIRI